LQTRKFRKKFEIKSGFVQKSTEEAHVQSDRCKCKNCIARSELHNKKINFMLNTEYICNEASRFHPKYIEFMEADYNERFIQQLNICGAFQFIAAINRYIELYPISMHHY
jgi:hypothetical protein